MAKPHILLIEDEAPIREMLRLALSKFGYTVSEAADTREARESIKEQLPDLMLVDWMLPGESGVELVRQLKREDLTRDIPVIMVTARIEEDDRVKGLEVGADDYVCKPFSPKELNARIKAVLRRTQPQLSDEPVEVESLRIEPDSHRVFANDEALEIGPTEFRILHFFMTHPERVYSRAQILDLVWGNNVYIEERTVDVHIRRLRKVLAPGGHDNLVQTVRGAGYRFSVRN
ncbi:phosphate regulon transcriptional regulator PhoB [Sulfuriflexus mobilis]|uniref:phosphate regulon transcriptional regulator PhoB n=1 Tax=Sulfuriflexus mobilis TaxID=1811807 RepID=UPI000F84046A|nr:phosphate regulon transcriptional regulator PhoB [Sulfuriflexus mobilis]